MTRYKISIEYDGTFFNGMQKQNETIPTVQLFVERALSKLFNEEIKIFYCGRTDAGVHALNQIAHFDSQKNRTPKQVVDGGNFFLDQNKPIAIKECQIVSNDFHSRFDARRRHYIYKIINRKQKLTFQKKTHCHIEKTINIQRLKEAFNFFIGQHDFSAFRSGFCQAKSPIKSIDKIEVFCKEVNQDEKEIEIHFYALSFLHHQIRNMVGTAVEYSIYSREANWIPSLLKGAKRSEAGFMAPPQGLYFLGAIYNDI